ncbi:MAG: tripartite tricarboxylate transporter TctB family protein [Lachnospiraceae bacterium]|jgi:hypothetical protein|nr:tripartite tricarboxylate transporter TctB family protein [Lachnospiraceae bacterium]MCI9109533.1 tripartite tricarboxylate transporter TctB family protein [Lachnospiraceae bacterium]MCI9342419.1 tripartite tricarboxylate transporter TctB family protein [Lachnospiraceae bacterium]
MKRWMDWLDEKRDTIGEKLSKKEMKLPIDIVTGVFFLLLGAVILLIMPKQVPVSDSDVINGQAFPTLLMAVMMICSGVVLAKELYNIFVKKMPPAMKNINLLVEVKALEILAILLLTYVICRVTDLFVVGAIFCSLAFLIYFRCRKLSYYAITLTVAVLIWIAFRFGLNVNF